MRAFTRLGALVFVSVLSLFTLIHLLPKSRVTEHLQKIALGDSINEVAAYIGWGKQDDEEGEGGIRLVVFGDSWVDDTRNEETEEGKRKGKSWVEILCEEINCTTHLNFASSQPHDSYPANPATGAITSNDVYLSTFGPLPESPSEFLIQHMLPDFETQVQSFLALPEPKKKPENTLFVVSFGLWDVYQFAGLEYTLGQNVTDRSINEIFKQLDVLYNGHMESQLLAPPSNQTHTLTPFQVLFTKVFDPTLLPGWLTQRPIPLKPSTVSEQQKNAIYLSNRWNSNLYNKLGAWRRELPEPPAPPAEAEPEPAVEPANETAAEPPTTPIQPKDEARKSTPLDARTPPTPKPADKKEPEPNPSDVAKDRGVPAKDIFYYDVSQYLLDLILENYLEDAGIQDATGLGKGSSPYESVDIPCTHSATLSSAMNSDNIAVDGTGYEEEGEKEGFNEVNGKALCNDADDYLWFSEFELGRRAKVEVGKRTAEMVMKHDVMGVGT